MPPRVHTDSRYESDLQQLRNALLYMGGEIEKNIHEAATALETSDETVAKAVIDRDHLINCLEVEIDDLCLRILALRQPAASDLRFITITLKIVTDLERIGDRAVHVAERVLNLSHLRTVLPKADLLEMARIAETMVRQSLDAFVRRDAVMASHVITSDTALDQLHVRQLELALTQMTRDPTLVNAGVDHINVAKHLERIGDHAVNISEMVIFLVEGKDVRHQWSRQHERSKNQFKSTTS